jgi:hypothetical protein
LDKRLALEKMFEQYREALRGEATRLACFIRVYRLLHERRGDQLAELNIAPASFIPSTYYHSY